MSIRETSAIVYATSSGKMFFDKQEAIDVDRGERIGAFAEKYGFSSMCKEDLATIIEENSEELLGILQGLQK